MKKNHKHNKETYTAQFASAAPNEPQKMSLNAPNVIFWLLGSILFFVFASQIVPVYLTEFNDTTSDSGYFNTIFGIVGIITYFVEPMMMVVYKPIEKEEDSKKPSWFSGNGLGADIVNGILFIVLLGPMLLLSFLKPVFRAFLLMISFSFLHLPGPESAPFVIIVLTDILLYFINFAFPEWRFSPAKLAVKLFRIKESPLLLNLGAVFYTLYTAFVYSFWLKMGYIDSGNITQVDDRIIVLLISWFLATLYVRMPFFSYNIDVVSFLKKISWSLILFHAIILIISFLAYMWPFLF